MSISASSLIITIGDSTSNSYVTLQEFIDYRDLNRINADAFDNASADDKVRSLIMAARKLNVLNWRGGKVNSTQFLAWPRLDVPIKDSTLAGYSSLNGFPSVYQNDYYFGDYYQGSEIPTIIKDAQCELAIAYLEGFEEVEGQRIKEFGVDGVRVVYTTNSSPGLLPVRISQMLSGLLAGERLVRG